MSQPSFIFTIRKDRIPANQICPIYLRYIYRSVWKDVPTGLRVFVNHWSSESGSPTLACEDRDTLLERMSAYSSIVKKIIEDRESNGESLMAKDVKPDIVARFKERHIIRPTKPTVEQAFIQYIETIRMDRKPSTIQTYETMMNQHLKSFCEESNRVLTWSLFDPDFGAYWKQYFITNKKQDSTAGKNFRRLHTFLKWASKKGYLGTNYFRDWTRIKEKSNVPVVCSEAELELIKAYARNSEKQAELRWSADMFLFLCYTGLRIGDFLELRYRNLYYDVGGDGIKSERYLIKISTEKTDVPITIPLIEDAFELILRYNNSFAKTYHTYKYSANTKAGFQFGMAYDVNPVIKQHPDRRLFPKIYKQDINKNIKIVGEECGINASFERILRYGASRIKKHKPKHALLTCHTGRRTFITLALMSGIQVPVIMRYTGHTSYKSIARYFSISEEYLHQQMEKFGSRDKQQPLTQMTQNFRSTFF